MMNTATDLAKKFCDRFLMESWVNGYRNCILLDSPLNHGAKLVGNLAYEFEDGSMVWEEPIKQGGFEVFALSKDLIDELK